jgi:hypothetical protein
MVSVLIALSWSGTEYHGQRIKSLFRLLWALQVSWSKCPVIPSLYAVIFVRTRGPKHPHEHIQGDIPSSQNLTSLHQGNAVERANERGELQHGLSYRGFQNMTL